MLCLRRSDPHSVLYPTPASTLSTSGKFKISTAANEADQRLRVPLTVNVIPEYQTVEAPDDAIECVREWSSIAVWSIALRLLSVPLQGATMRLAADFSPGGYKLLTILFAGHIPQLEAERLARRVQSFFPRAPLSRHQGTRGMSIHASIGGRSLAGSMPCRMLTLTDGVILDNVCSMVALRETRPQTVQFSAPIDRITLGEGPMPANSWTSCGSLSL